MLISLIKSLRNLILINKEDNVINLSIFTNHHIDFIRKKKDKEELEIRFGQHTKFGFNSFVSEAKWFKLFSWCNIVFHIKNITEDEVETDKNNIRKIKNKKGLIKYEKKIKENIDIKNYGVRLSSSTERSIDERYFMEKCIVNKRKRIRYTFTTQLINSCFHIFNIDMTIVNDNQYEIELELKKYFTGYEYSYIKIKMEKCIKILLNILDE